MYICELRFDSPDPEDPSISHLEVDYYAWIPPGGEVPNHRLSLRKNLVTGEFEIYRAYTRAQMGVLRDRILMLTFKESGIEEVAYRGGFKEAIDFANKETSRYHEISDRDEPCRHEYPHVDMFCPRRYDRRTT